MWWIYALLSAFFAALTALFAKKGVEHIDSDFATAVRTIVILVITWTIVLLKGNGPLISSLSAKNLTYLILSGSATGLSWLFYFKALQVGPVSLVAPVDKMSVVIVIILAAVFLREPVTLKSVVGGLLVVAGTIVLIKA